MQREAVVVNKKGFAAEGRISYKKKEYLKSSQVCVAGLSRCLLSVVLTIMKLYKRRRPSYLRCPKMVSGKITQSFKQSQKFGVFGGLLIAEPIAIVKNTVLLLHSRKQFQFLKLRFNSLNSSSRACRMERYRWGKIRQRCGISKQSLPDGTV